jgi:hypothetical protein
MASTLVALADAIVARLNAGSFSLPFEARRGYRPVVELPDLTAVVVTVIPKSLTISAATRADGFYDCAIDVGVQRKVNAEEREPLDDLMRWVEEIGDHLRAQPLDAFPAATWLSLENDPIFVPDHLEKEHVFTSVLTVTYKVRR